MNKSSFYQSTTWIKNCVYSPSAFSFEVKTTAFDQNSQDTQIL